VRADRAFLALPKYVGFFVSEYEPAAATDMSADKNPPSSAAIFSLSADRMVYEANPAAISCRHYGCLYINVFWKHHRYHSFRYVLLYPEAAKLKILAMANNSALCSAGGG
jgi:hypothetical protein